MRHWYSVVANQNGVPVSGATVTVNLHGGSAATLYSDNGITPIANPVTADAYGRYNFYVANGRYDLVIASGTANYTQSDVEISDGSGVLNQQGSAAAITGNGADQNLFSYTMPLNTLVPSRGIRVHTSWLHLGTTGVKYKLQLGGTALETMTFYDGVGTVSKAIYEIFNNSAVQNAQNWTRDSSVMGSVVSAIGTSSANFANQIVVTFTFNVASPDTVAPQYFMVEEI